MNKTKNRITAIAIAIFLTLSMTASLVLIPSASAHTPPIMYQTYAYISVEPNTIGVGQTTNVYMWINPVFGMAALVNNYRFRNYELTITSPSGTKTTETFAYISDPTSNQGTTFTPTAVGTYIFNFTFPGQAFNTDPHSTTSLLVNDTYLPSYASATLTVQSTPIAAATTSEPLPTNYWSRPIYGLNTNWNAISSNWLGSGQPGYGGPSQGPNAQAFPGLYSSDNAVGSATSHIMWTYPLQEGGIVGGNALPSGVAYFGGTAYNPRFQNPIIVDGYLYYTMPVNWANRAGTGGPTVCQNLQTGQIIWSNSKIPSLSFAYVYDVWTPNYHGVWAAILVAPVTLDTVNGVTGATIWELFDAYTGDALFNVTNVPAASGATVLGPMGEQIRYVFANAGTTANPNWTLAQWNSSKLFFLANGASPVFENPAGIQIASSYIPIPVQGAAATLANGTAITLYPGTALTEDASVNNPGLPNDRYDWNVSVPWLNVMGNQTETTLANAAATVVKGYTGTGPNPDSTNPVTVEQTFFGDMMLCRNGTYPTNTNSAAGTTGYVTPSLNPYTYFAVNLNATVGPIGSVLWWNTLPIPPGNLTVLFAGANQNVFVENYRETNQFVGYSMTTGQKIWGPTAAINTMYPWDYYGSPGPGTIDTQVAYGNLYVDGYAGVLFCYDLANGNLLWTFGNGGEGNSTSSGLNTVYGNYPNMITDVGNGIIYTDTCEHTVTDPIYKGAMTYAINATNGKQIWELSDFTGSFSGPAGYAIADGYTTFFNEYDSQIYTVGQGSSATTVQAPLTQITAGNSVVIQGTVMDTSPGTQQTTVKADFANGVPCSSDASMSNWMAYVYQQQAEPTNFTGVTVTLTAIDPNGNFVTLGTATTDATGHFIFAWQPPAVPGKYTVTATFAGTNGYWGSSDETGMFVQSAPPSATPTATPVTGLATMSGLTIGIAAAVIAIIIAIAIVGLLLLRKKP